MTGMMGDRGYFRTCYCCPAAPNVRAREKRQWQAEVQVMTEERFDKVMEQELPRWQGLIDRWGYEWSEDD